MGSEGWKHLSKTYGWLSFGAFSLTNPKTAKVLLRTTAWFPSATKVAFAHWLVLASCKSKTHARPEHAFPRRERQQKAQAMKTPGKGWPTRGGLSQERLRLLRSVRSTETGCPAPRGACTTLSSPTSRAEQLGELPVSPLRGKGAPQGPRWLQQGEGHVWGKGELGTKADPPHPPKGCYPPKSPQIQRGTRSPLIR